MKLRRFASSLVCLALLVALSSPALALPEDCDTKCAPSTPDYIACACPGLFQATTCGEWRAGTSCGPGGPLAPLPSDIGLPNTVLTDLGIDF